MLMSNGPAACIAEIVENTVAKPRERQSIHHEPNYYDVRNHLVDFLVNRSKRYQSGELRTQRASSAKIVNLR
jgi:nitrate/nitrite transport system ATP-binding protein